MQTIEETWDPLPAGFNARNERQCRPEEPVELFGEAQQHDSSMSVEIFH